MHFNNAVAEQRAENKQTMGNKQHARSGTPIDLLTTPSTPRAEASTDENNRVRIGLLTANYQRQLLRSQLAGDPD